MGVADWFLEFDRALQLKNPGSITTRFKAIARQLNKDFWGIESDTEHCFLVGSVGRGTAAEPLQNLNMIVELPPAKKDEWHVFEGNGQVELLYEVKNSMKVVYETAIIGAEGRIPFVVFKDGITFELMPVFVHNAKSYIYPDPANEGRWKTMMPIPEVKEMRLKDRELNGNLSVLCRMTRAWAYKWNAPVSGLLIDTLAYKFLDQYEEKLCGPEGRGLMCAEFFKWLATSDKGQKTWRAPGSNQEVYKDGGFHMQAKRTYDIALEAIALGSAVPARDFNAKQKWREVFGTKFPV